MTTDTSEKGLESLFVRAMTGRTDLLSPPHQTTETGAPVVGGTGWLLGEPPRPPTSRALRRWRQGWMVASVERLNCGYDLQCQKGRARRHIEVKGVSGDDTRFLITFNEVETARADGSYWVCIVTGATGKRPRMWTFTGAEFLERFDLRPIQFMATPRS